MAISTAIRTIRSFSNAENWRSFNAFSKVKVGVTCTSTRLIQTVYPFAILRKRALHGFSAFGQF
jgi:hypothetical protein